MKRQKDIQGFTLVETLVTLVVISLIGTMIFQTIGYFSLVQEKLIAHGQMGIEKKRAESWFRESIQGATPAILSGRKDFSGDSINFELTTIVPLTKLSGYPQRIKWSIDQRPGHDTLAYAEVGSESWTVLDRLERRSSYLQFIDQHGSSYDSWPVEDTSGEELILTMVRFHADGEEPLDWYVVLENRGLGWVIEE